MPGYTEKHATSGLQTKLPKLETFPSQFQNYEISIAYPEFTSICPKTGLPDFGTLHIQYGPDKSCLELKALKMYLLAYREVGIFYENLINRVLQDCVKACQPTWMVVTGVFNARGGMIGRARVQHGNVPITASLRG